MLLTPPNSGDSMGGSSRSRDFITRITWRVTLDFFWCGRYLPGICMDSPDPLGGVFAFTRGEGCGLCCLGSNWDNLSSSIRELIIPWWGDDEDESTSVTGSGESERPESLIVARCNLNRFLLATPTLGDPSGRGSSSSVDSHEIRLLFLTLDGQEEDSHWGGLGSLVFTSVQNKTFSSTNTHVTTPLRPHPLTVLVEWRKVLVIISCYHRHQ